MNIHLDKEQIKSIIPQRDPILLADSADISENICESSFFVCPDMEIFKGHFPENPMLPGVYIIEAMAQCADILLLNLPGNKGAAPILYSAGPVRFLRPVLPSDTLVCKAEIISGAANGAGEAADNIGGIYECRVSAFVNDKKSAQGTLSLCLKS